MNKPTGTDTRESPWIPLSASTRFLFGNKQLLGWSALLVLITALLTWLGFILTTGMMDRMTGAFFSTPPLHESIWGWITYGAWVAGYWIFLIVSRIIAFFLAFLTAYSLSAPLYVFLSTATEKLYCREEFKADDGFSAAALLRDLLEGAKIGLFGILVTIVALAVSFIPFLGQVAVFILYAFYSALMFIDYPTSRRRWRLGQKISWLNRHKSLSFRLGVIPAGISMIPVLNLFLMALIFPLFTVHATLNFYTAERMEQRR
ncbi:MAG: cysteine biosynthesis protein [Proteobacteria bacterium]|nr:MAG: cysteine biosynthesis protein [Pseudomonadota bacterium]